MEPALARHRSPHSPTHISGPVFAGARAAGRMGQWGAATPGDAWRRLARWRSSRPLKACCVLGKKIIVRPAAGLLVSPLWRKGGGVRTRSNLSSSGLESASRPAAAGAPRGVGRPAARVRTGCLPSRRLSAARRVRRRGRGMVRGAAATAATASPRRRGLPRELSARFVIVSGGLEGERGIGPSRHRCWHVFLRHLKEK